jgi:hypothetical protein
MSPITLAFLVADTYAAHEQTQGHSSIPWLLLITILLFAAPIVAIILNATGTFMLNRPNREHRVVLGH